MIWIQTSLIAGSILGVALFYLYIYIRVPTFLFADNFLRMVEVQRTVYISGRKGGGKTSLGIVIMAYLYAKGIVDYLHANIPSVMMTKASLPIGDCAFLIDECQDHIKAAADAAAAEAFIRKLNIYLIMAGVGAPHRSLTTLTCMRVWNAYVIGLPVWVYKWSWKLNGETEKGWFLLVRPSQMFWFYDTTTIPVDDGGLFGALDSTVLMHKQIEAERLEETGEIIAHDSATDGEEIDHEETADNRKEKARSNNSQNGARISDTERAEKVSAELADTIEALVDSSLSIEESVAQFRKTVAQRKRLR